MSEKSPPRTILQMDAPAGEHAEDLERTTTLLNRIREVYANG